ncbi:MULTISPECIES: hypothetical protein [unclassified Gilliamella]|uniref:hypothetical protein n=1 Tax=unclassified Gilliamella TaxID=2685620 RepID=UPI002269E7D9|nr:MULTISPECIES: hypothetical protein [unclassified Gilliamella]MCX8588913.1 hypothetical protein [Gilliamella sp. B3801]MCX8592903.1 hypothetical protein [Gilliamella sp. B3804]
MKKISIIFILLAHLSFVIQAQEYQYNDFGITKSFEFGPSNSKNSSNQQRDIIEAIYFEKDVQLSWNSSIDDFDIDFFFVNNKNDKKTVEILVNNIQNTEWVYLPTKLKLNELTKGDIAFLYLIQLKNIEPNSCLHHYFDVYGYSNSKYPEGILDYLDYNRLEVQNKMRICLSDKGYL